MHALNEQGGQARGIRVKIPETERARLADTVARQGVTLSALVRRALAAECDRIEQQERVAAR